MGLGTLPNMRLALGLRPALPLIFTHIGVELLGRADGDLGAFRNPDANPFAGFRMGFIGFRPGDLCNSLSRLLRGGRGAVDKIGLHEPKVPPTR